MKLKITIQLQNAAFNPDAGTEVARILRDLAESWSGRRWAVVGSKCSLRDVNGNIVGDAKVVDCRQELPEEVAEALSRPVLAAARAARARAEKGKP